MSIRLMSQVWECDLDHPEQAILLAMADHADDNGEHVFPGIDRIAWKTGYQERQVRRIGKKLRAMGVLVQTARPTRTRPTEYRIDLAVLPRKPSYNPSPDKMSGDNERTFQDKSKADDRTFSALSPDIAMSGESSLEPSLKDQPSITSRSRAPTQKKKGRKDERRNHPAITQLYQVIGRQPKTIFLDDIIAMADPDRSGRSRFDIQKLKDLVRIADSVGCQPDNLLVWLLPDEGWYVAGVPLRWRGRAIEIGLANKYRNVSNVSGSNSTSNKPAQFWRPLNWRELGLKPGDPRYKWKAEELNG